MSLLYKHILITGIRQLKLFHESITTYPQCTRAASFATHLKICASPSHGSTTANEAITSQEFYQIIRRCPDLETIVLPDQIYWYDWMLSSEMPELKMLSKIVCPNPVQYSKAKIMVCYTKYRLSLSHMFIFSNAIPFTHGSLLAYIGIFNQLETLFIQHFPLATQNAHPFDDILDLCPQLTTFVCSNTHINQFPATDKKHLSLSKLELVMTDVHASDIHTIKSRLPHLRELKLIAINPLEDQSGTIHASLDLKNLSKLDFGLSITSASQYQTSLHLFDHHFHPHKDYASKSVTLMAPFSEEFRLTLSYTYAAGIYHLSVTASLWTSPEGISPTLAIPLHHPIRTVRKEYIENYGQYLTELYIWEAHLPLSDINNYCPALTKLTFAVRQMLVSAIPTLPNPYLHTLVLQGCQVNNKIMKLVGEAYPRLKMLELKMVDLSFECPGYSQYYLDLPETGLESLKTDFYGMSVCHAMCHVVNEFPSYQGDPLAYEGSQHQLDLEEERRVSGPGHEENPYFVFKHYYFVSSTLKPCILQIK
ncbi:hypothetical protein BDB01DRAFT_854791 [Pilobolus umbonatus]|nr:hypothetical protein BDB01DRAFT_854791 [Pilobolus umbonatus]